ncbi:MAG: serine/threonine-protein kinase [Planctomycetota bacterium]
MSSESLTVYDLQPGKVVGGRYEVVSAHRQGGLSTAFEVRDTESDERCEMQLFPGALFDGDAQIHDFSASWNPWKRVESAAVLRVRDILALGDATLVLVSDFPSGDSLRAVLNSRKHLPLEDAVRFGVQLLEGLVEIHAHGLVHGDIKPYTIHISGEGGDAQAVLVDGGITPGLWTAKDLGDKTALIGTPYYAPVEQFGGDSPDVQSDIYNVATVLFECIAGLLPWNGTSFLEVFQAKLDKTPPSLRKRMPELDIDPELEAAIVTGCLADKKQRYATAKSFVERLRPFLDA